MNINQISYKLLEYNLRGKGNTLWDMSSKLGETTHVKFYNRYLLLLEEFTAEQESKACSNW
jgi:hypothetical protein